MLFLSFSAVLVAGRWVSKNNSVGFLSFGLSSAFVVVPVFSTSTLFIVMNVRCTCSL
jgi:hypothetical protein